MGCLAHAGRLRVIHMIRKGQACWSAAGAKALYAALGDWKRFRDGAHAASYLGLSPSTRQSANHCYHGPITKAGNSLARWLLTQAARQVAQHPGPLGVFFRRIHQRKNFNVAVVATARKLVTIGFLNAQECRTLPLQLAGSDPA